MYSSFGSSERRSLVLVVSKGGSHKRSIHKVFCRFVGDGDQAEGSQDRVLQGSRNRVSNRRILAVECWKCFSRSRIFSIMYVDSVSQNCKKKKNDYRRDGMALCGAHQRRKREMPRIPRFPATGRHREEEAGAHPDRLNNATSHVFRCHRKRLDVRKILWLLWAM